MFDEKTIGEKLIVVVNDVYPVPWKNSTEIRGAGRKTILEQRY